jgi:hypothetical protein
LLCGCAVSKAAETSKTVAVQVVGVLVVAVLVVGGVAPQVALAALG